MRATLAASAAVFLAIAAPLAAAQPAAPAAARAATPAARASEDARLTAFLDQAFTAELALRPQLATRLGLKDGQDRWDDNSDAGVLRRIALRRASVAAMKARFNRAALSPAGQINYDIWASDLDRMELQYKYRRFQPPFYSSLYATPSELPNFLINTHTVESMADMRAWIARLGKMPQVLDLALAQTRASEAAGVRVPRFQVERLMASARTLTGGAPFGTGADAPLMADARAKVGKLVSAGKVSPAEGDTLLAQARTALLATAPAYGRVIAWGQGALKTAPSGRVGAVSLPGGKDWYAAALRLNTTLPLSAAQIHATGLAEVKRIEAEQDALARQAGLADRNAFYADREKRFPSVPYTDETRAAYLKAANDAVARNRAALGSQFTILPKYRAEVVREPSFTELAGGAAHAGGPSPDGVRPGRVYVHLVGNTLDPAKTQDLMCHEGIPGHVMAGDIAVRQQGVPRFRQSTGYVAYSEGWALYAEKLCKDMGVYPDIASDFMRLDAELFRAARLVTDTGIHDLGWTEDQAVRYMTDTGRLPPQQARSEVRRYITLPGQATGYKIGMLKIMELRARAEKALGSRFDVRAFNDLIVGGGSMPLPVLETRVNEWIAARKA
ncbi:DUF885 domain-containing protein [Parablastomonas sp. CN1-191]|uniref:DUF885 domain-containing protein n=1 Tax=Parablastomonas sp. CN1-191 TaxID=3400908 RepID=UPI003BF82C60